MAHVVRWLGLALLLALTGLAGPVTAQGAKAKELIILTTTSTQDRGILRVITDAFAKKSGVPGDDLGRVTRPGLDAVLIPRVLRFDYQTKVGALSPWSVATAPPVRLTGAQRSP